jgi:hypothetical protein
MNDEHERLVTVFATDDEGTIAVAASILESAEIPFFEKGGASRSFGLQVFNLSASLVEFQVREQDADAARELLSHLAEGKAEE